MFNRLMLCAVLAATTIFAADVTGKWRGFVNRADGTRQTDLILEVAKDGDAIKGSVGPGDEDPRPLKDAKLEGDKLTFKVEAESDDGKILFDVILTADGDDMKGEVTRTAGAQKPAVMKIELKREK